ncbi:MAG: tRNA lysidine(34) synthetase TilS [Planctomycetes bacterium RBG_16_64_10]|nr:MAG: tRNA lysidine(34) synthetase TilS [Planctomycetes bacterium RBG_16_64_10]
MSPLDPIEERLAEAWPPACWSDVTVLLAVSGGADSVAALRALTRLQGNGPGELVVGHVNHGLRAAESDADERFVREQCHRWGVSCEVERLAPGQLDARSGDGREAAARRARYQRLRAMAERRGARYVVTAHTADDQAETILHHILRGTGLAGLAGIRRARSLGPAATLIRPMLGFRRAELVGYLKALDQPYREDQTNRDLGLTRNAIRHQLLPQLAQRYNVQVVDALLRLGRLAGEAQQVIDAQVRGLMDRGVSVDRDGSMTVCRRSLEGQPDYLVRATLMAAWRARAWPCQAIGHAEWQTLADMVGGKTPEATIRCMPGGIRAEQRGDRLLLRPPWGPQGVLEAKKP